MNARDDYEAQERMRRQDLFFLVMAPLLLIISVAINYLCLTGKLWQMYADISQQVATANYIFVVMMLYSCFELLRRFFSEETTLYRSPAALIYTITLFTVSLALIFVAEQLSPDTTYPHRLFT